MNREINLQRLHEKNKVWDIVVIGGGASGLGVALDAASRGLAVALFEKADFAKGTSSRSTKLIHGGVRYLAQGQISLVFEALKERGAGAVYAYCTHAVLSGGAIERINGSELTELGASCRLVRSIRRGARLFANLLVFLPTPVAWTPSLGSCDAP